MEHVDSADCWCFPLLMQTHDTNVWIHRDEKGNLPSPGVLADLLEKADLDCPFPRIEIDDPPPARGGGR